jgi:pimeloyl-ACP methyl ester carboxylesterase
MPISGELRYDAFCQGGLDPTTGEPLGCHYGSWNYTSQINPAEHLPPARPQPPLLMVHGTADTVVPIREAHAMAAQAERTGCAVNDRCTHARTHARTIDRDCTVSPLRLHCSH